MKKNFLFWAAALYGFVGFILLETNVFSFNYFLFAPSVATAYILSTPLNLIREYNPDLFNLSKVVSSIFIIFYSFSNSFLWIAPLYYKRIYFFFLRLVHGICGSDTCHLYFHNVPKRVSIHFSKKVFEVKKMTHNDVLSAFIGMIYGVLPPFLGYSICSDGFISMFFGPSYIPSLFLVGVTQSFFPLHLAGDETTLLLIFNGLVWAYAIYSLNRFMSKRNLKKKYILLIPWGLAFIVFFEVMKLWLCLL